MIMKKNILLATALAITALVSCTDDSFVGDQKLQDANSNAGAISFGMSTPAVTRATGGDAATALGNRFIVYGEKGGITAVAPTAGNLVFPNYQVNYVASTAYSTTSNTKNWEYVGAKHSDNYVDNITRKATSETAAVTASDAEQTIKYWDYGAANYVFTAVSALDGDIESGRVKIQKNEYGSTAFDKGYTITLDKSGSGSYTYPQLNKLYFSDRKVIAGDGNSDPTSKDKYGGYVELSFRNLVAQIRAGVYETIPGYDITEIKFYVNTSGETPTQTQLAQTTGESPVNAFGAVCPNTKTDNFTGNIVVTYYNGTDGNLNEPKITVTPGEGLAKTNLILGTNMSTLTTSKLLGKASNTPTWDIDGGSFTEVLPQISNSTNLNLKVDYKLWNSVSGETIEVKGATAVVPAEYLKWKPNYKYTYLFKISDNTNGQTGTGETPAGLWPISFDAVTIEADNGTQETITTVSSPSITTYAHGKVVTENDEYLVGNIYIVVNNGTALTIGTDAKLYTATITGSSAAQGITEETVANALTKDPDGSGNYVVTDALGGTLTVTPVTPSAGDKLQALTTIPAADAPGGKALDITGAWFAATAPASGTKYYVFEYTYTESATTKKAYKVIKVVAAP